MKIGKYYEFKMTPKDDTFFDGRSVINFGEPRKFRAK